MQVTDKLTKALTEAKYLNADNVSRYRCIMRIFLLGQGPVEQSSTNKPLAMRVVEDALAYSKKPPVI